MALAKAASTAALSPNAIVTPTIAARALLPDFQRRGLRRLLEIDERRQQLVVDRHELGGVARLRLRFGDDEGDAVADAADAVGEQNRARGRKTGRPTPGVPA